MVARDNAEAKAAEIMGFRHTGDDPPQDVVINGVHIDVTEDSTVTGLARQIRAAEQQKS